MLSKRKLLKVPNTEISEGDQIGGQYFWIVFAKEIVQSFAERKACMELDKNV